MEHHPSHCWALQRLLDFTPAAPLQGFKVENPLGTGKIRDLATGRCLALMKCSGSDANLNTCTNMCAANTCAPARLRLVMRSPESAADPLPSRLSCSCSLSGDHSVVVLDMCSDSADGCGGKSQQWKVHPAADKPGYGVFESALGPRCLNAALHPVRRCHGFSPHTLSSGTVSMLTRNGMLSQEAVEGFSLIVWNCALTSCGSPGINSNQCFHFDPTTGHLTTPGPSETPDGCKGEDCCLTGKNCVAPCSLPMGWGGWVLFGALILASVYLGSSMAYTARAGTLDLGAPATWSPHKPQLLALVGLVVDGAKFATDGFMLPQAGTDKPSGRALLVDSAAEMAVREARETAAAGLRKKQKQAKVGHRTGLQEAAMVGDLKKVKKVLLAKEKGLDKGDPRGQTAFHHACAGGHVDCVKELVKAGCDTLRMNDGGVTGWELARKSGRTATLEALRKYGSKGHEGLQLELALEEATAAEEAAATAAVAR